MVSKGEEGEPAGRVEKRSVQGFPLVLEINGECVRIARACPHFHHRSFLTHTF